MKLSILVGLGCNVVWTCRQIRSFRRNMLPLSPPWTPLTSSQANRQKIDKYRQIREGEKERNKDLKTMTTLYTYVCGLPVFFLRSLYRGAVELRLSEAQSTGLTVIRIDVAIVLCFKWNWPPSPPPPHLRQGPPTKIFLRLCFSSTGINCNATNQRFVFLFYYNLLIFYLYFRSCIFRNQLSGFLLSEQL
jgi:hypothetical protein